MTWTPWGRSQHQEFVAPGVVSHETAGHGGLHLSPERWRELPPEVRENFLNTHWAEEDCEESIVRALLGLAGTPYRLAVHVRLARRTAEMFPCYAAALDHLPEEEV